MTRNSSFKNKISDFRPRFREGKFFKDRKNVFLFSCAMLAVIIVALVIGLRHENPGIVATNEGDPADLALAQFQDKKTSTPSTAIDTSASANKGKKGKANSAAPNAPRPAACALSLSLSPRQKAIVSGGNIDYAMTLTNSGSVACQNASISIYYADNETFVSASPAATSSNYYWSIGTLAGGAQKTFSMTTTSNDSGATSVDTEACATADNGQDSCSDSSVAFGSAVVANTDAPAVAKTGGITLPKLPDIFPAKQTAAPVALGDREYGTWVWVTPTRITKTYANTVVDAAAANRINAIYVTFDDYLEINALPAGANKDAKIKAYSDAVQSFVEIARAKGIAVDAEAGARDWGEPENHSKAFAIIDYVASYNATHPNAPIRGFQFDVESYLLPSYDNDKAGTLTKFVSLVAETAAHMSGMNLRFAVVLPHFYDGAIGWTPSLTYAGTSGHAFEQVLNILDKRADSSIIIMAYRNFSEGTNGSIDLSNAEVNEASGAGHTTRIIVAQETGNVDPDYVTFYGMTKNQYLAQVNLIINAFSGQSRFGGIAVHYIDPFLELN